MLGFRIHRVLAALLMLSVLWGCSKKPEVEEVLESYYRAALEGDPDMENKIDPRLFKMTRHPEEAARGSLVGLMLDIHRLSEANGKFQKITVTGTEEVQSAQLGSLLRVKHDLVFKNGHTISRQEYLSRPDGSDGKLKILMNPEG